MYFLVASLSWAVLNAAIYLSGGASKDEAIAFTFLIYLTFAIPIIVLANIAARATVLVDLMPPLLMFSIVLGMALLVFMLVTPTGLGNAGSSSRSTFWDWWFPVTPIIVTYGYKVLKLSQV